MGLSAMYSHPRLERGLVWVKVPGGLPLSRSLEHRRLFPKQDLRRLDSGRENHFGSNWEQCPARSRKPQLA